MRKRDGTSPNMQTRPHVLQTIVFDRKRMGPRRGKHGEHLGHIRFRHNSLAKLFRRFGVFRQKLKHDENKPGYEYQPKRFVAPTFGAINVSQGWAKMSGMFVYANNCKTMNGFVANCAREPRWRAKTVVRNIRGISLRFPRSFDWRFPADIASPPPTFSKQLGVKLVSRNMI